MAIYQFYIATIPKKGVIQHFGKIPDKFEVDFQKRTEFFFNDEDEFDYFEFIQHKCWKIAEVNSREIIKQIDQKLNRANWGNDKESNNWNTETKEEDNDAWVLTNSEQNQIVEFTFRADLRQPKLKFLNEMIELSKEKELLLIDRKGNIVEPEMAKVIELIKKSDALKFVENTIKFLSNLEKVEINTE